MIWDAYVRRAELGVDVQNGNGFPDRHALCGILSCTSSKYERLSGTPQRTPFIGKWPRAKSFQVVARGWFPMSAAFRLAVVPESA